MSGTETAAAGCFPSTAHDANTHPGLTPLSRERHFAEEFLRLLDEVAPEVDPIGTGLWLAELGREREEARAWGDDT